MAATPRSKRDLDELGDDALISREEIGIIAGIRRPAGERHKTVNQWVFRHGVGGQEPPFPDGYDVEGNLLAWHRIGEVRAWLQATRRAEIDEASPAAAALLLGIEPDVAARLMSKREVAHLLDVSESTVGVWAWKKILPPPAVKIGRASFWDRVDIIRWNAAGRAAPAVAS